MWVWLFIFEDGREEELKGLEVKGKKVEEKGEDVKLRVSED